MLKSAMLAIAGSVPFFVAYGPLAAENINCPNAAPAKPATAPAVPAAPQVSQNGRQAYRSYSADPAATSASTMNSSNYSTYRAPIRSGRRSANLYRADRKIRGLGQ